MLSALTLCNGMSTFIKKCLCSSLSGSAKPLIMLCIQNITSHCHVKYTVHITSWLGVVDSAPRCHG